MGKNSVAAQLSAGWDAQNNAFRDLGADLTSGNPQRMGQGLLNSYGVISGVPSLQGFQKGQQNNAPQLQSPDANSSTPTLEQTNTTALQNQLTAEGNARSTSTFLSNQGLLEDPMTTSRVLMGY